MKKITMLLLAALLLIGIASAASAFEYAPAEKLEIDGIEVNKVWVDMIPVYYTLPADYQEGQDMKICLFLSGLSGNKESLVSTYSDFITSRGYVGVFFDHYEHGERSINGTTILNSSEDEVAALKKKILDTCFENMYRYGWEILGNSILDAERVIDWFTANMPVTEVVMGGHSMGGDTSVAVAGIDERVNRILCVVTTPDWLRPGMHDLFTGEDMDPGKPDAKSQWYYDQFNPITHLSRYTRGMCVSPSSAANLTRTFRPKMRSASSPICLALRRMRRLGCRFGGTRDRATSLRPPKTLACSLTGCFAAKTSSSRNNSFPTHTSPPVHFPRF